MQSWSTSDIGVGLSRSYSRSKVHAMSKKITNCLLWLCLAVHPLFSIANETSGVSAYPEKQTDQQGIHRVMKTQFDRPGSPLGIPVVSIESDYAIAGWTQDGRGGRALLKKENGKWSIHLCGGEGLKQLSTLTLAGVDKTLGSRLLDKVSSAERKLPADQIRKFSMFDGVIKVDGLGHAAHSRSRSHGELSK